MLHFFSRVCYTRAHTCAHTHTHTHTHTPHGRMDRRTRARAHTHTHSSSIVETGNYVLHLFSRAHTHSSLFYRLSHEKCSSSTSLYFIKFKNSSIGSCGINEYFLFIITYIFMIDSMIPFLGLSSLFCLFVVFWSSCMSVWPACVSACVFTQQIVCLVICLSVSLIAAFICTFCLLFF